MMRLRLLAARMMVRSLFVQASWNFQRMQNLGYFLLAFPVLLQRHGRGSAGLARDALRDLELFNTHPYFAGLVAGTVAGEEMAGEGREITVALKRSLMCSLGSVGDEFFWAHLRPCAALLALPFALAQRPWAPLVLLAAFNIPHLGIRYWGISAGLRRGRDVVGFLQTRPLSRTIPAIAAAMAFLAGATAGAIATRGAWRLLPGEGPLPAAGTVLVFLGFVGLQIRGVAPGRLLLAASVLALLAGAARLAVGS